MFVALRAEGFQKKPLMPQRFLGRTSLSSFLCSWMISRIIPFNFEFKKCVSCLQEGEWNVVMNSVFKTPLYFSSRFYRSKLLHLFLVKRVAICLFLEYPASWSEPSNANAPAATVKQEIQNSSIRRQLKISTHLPGWQKGNCLLLLC